MTCKFVKHRNCNTVQLREKGATYIVSDIQNIIQNVHSLEEEIKRFRLDRDAEVKRIESMVEKAHEKIKRFRKDLDIFLDTLENDMLMELEEKAKAMRYDAEQYIPACKDTLRLLDDDSKLLDDASKCSNAEMMFATDVKISKRLTELRSMMKDFHEKAQIATS